MYKRFGLFCICATFSKEYNQLFSKPFTGATESGSSIGVFNFGEILPSLYQNFIQGQFLFFEKKIRSHHTFIIWSPAFTLPIQTLLRLWTFPFRRNTLTVKAVSQLNCLEELKKLRLTLQMKDPILHLLVAICDPFSNVILTKKFDWCWEGKNYHIPQLANDIVLIHFHDKYGTDWVQ